MNYRNIIYKQIKSLNLTGVPFDDIILHFITTHGVGKADEFEVFDCEVTPQIITAIAKQISARNKKVRYVFINIDTSDVSTVA